MGVLQPDALDLARDFYDLQIAKGKSHHPALRALGNRWVELLWHCLHRGVHDSEAIHLANRNPRLEPDRLKA